MFKTNLSLLGLTALFSLCASSAFADMIAYNVTVNTSSIAGTSGYLELQLNTGTLPSQAISSTVLNFAGATLNSTDPNNFSSTGTYPLAGPLTLASTTSTDYFEAATFTNSITFQVVLSGPGVSLAGNATSQSATDFIIDFMDSTTSNYLLTNDPNGIAGDIDIAINGIVTPIANPNATGGPSDVSFSLVPATVPEPATFVLVGLSLLVAFLVRIVNRATER